ncbi:hypothetical protein GCM10027578_22290 [Spirosoma luteolum]
MGTQERTWRNDHPLFDYYRVLGGNANRSSVRGWKDAYCAYGVYAWHRQAGVKPPVPALGRAVNWSLHPSKILLGRRSNPLSLGRLEPGWVIGFRFAGNHVGIIEQPYPLYAITIEANTSLSNAVGKYKTNHEGVIRKRRFYKDAAWAADWRGSPHADTLSVFTLRKRYAGP